MATLIKNTGNKDSGTREYLTFRLGEEEYGIDILKVQESVAMKSLHALQMHLILFEVL